MLYHSVHAGLDMAIINPAQIKPYAEIPEIERRLAEDLDLQPSTGCPSAINRALSNRSMTGSPKRD